MSLIPSCESALTAPHRSKKSLFFQSDTSRQTKETRAWDSNFCSLILLQCWKYPEVKVNWKVQFLSIENPVLSWSSPVVSPLATKPSCSEGSEAVGSSPQGFSLSWKTSLGLHLSLGQAFLEPQRLSEAWKGNNNRNEPFPLHQWQQSPLVMAG